MVMYVAALVFTIITIVVDTSNSAKSLGYILVIIVIPVVGMALYYSIGINYRKRKLYRKKLIEDNDLFKIIRRHVVDVTEQQIHHNPQLIDEKEGVVRMLLKDNISPLAPAVDVKLLINGGEKFDELLQALEEAKEHIHIQYYIFVDDEIGNKIKDILIRKAEEGVKVRFIMDDFGSHGLHKRMLSEFEKSKVEVAVFYKIRLYALANRLNYRNHRKIVVIDGNIGFVGGINVEDKYINNGKFKLFWRDTHLRIKGGASVLMLQATFIRDWNFCSKNKIELDLRYFSTEMGKGHKHLVQVASSGPDSSRPSIMLSTLGIITASKKRLYITTPYFIPSESIVDAIVYAALSGVDVRMLVPGISDSKIVNSASSSYYGRLLKAGVKIYRYQKGFVHAKTIVSDDTLAVVGSANMDIRSFDLNFEVTALVFSREINNELFENFMKDIEDSEELHEKEWLQRSWFKQFGNALARLVSPLL